MKWRDSEAAIVSGDWWKKASSENALSFPTSEPVAAVGYPPAKNADRNRRQERPEDGQAEIRYEPQRNERGPENLALHRFILARNCVIAAGNNAE